MLWDTITIPDAEMEAYRSIESFVAKKWNGNGDSVWRLDLGNIDYGLLTITLKQTNAVHNSFMS